MNWKIVKIKDRTYDIVSDDDGFDSVLMTISDENIEMVTDMPEIMEALSLLYHWGVGGCSMWYYQRKINGCLCRGQESER